MTPFKEVQPGDEPSMSGVDQIDGPREGARSGFAKRAPSSPLSPAELKIIGRYDLLSSIGSGDMGEVFRAFDQQTQEEIALKLLQPEYLSDPTRCAMFRREVRLARKVTHRNVARVFDFETVGDLPYLTREYIEGVALTDIIASDQYPTDDEVLSVLLELSRGLSAAHKTGLIHRGIKPSNVIVSADGRVVLTDFGLAPLREEKETVNPRSGGTALYMAPEQVLSGSLSKACDCYSLGLIAYQLATKRLPFQSSGYAQVVVRLQLSTSDPRAHRPEISESVSSIIRRCLYRDPARRWESMSDLVSAVERLRAQRFLSRPGPVRGRSSADAPAGPRGPTEKVQEPKSLIRELSSKSVRSRS